MIKYKLRKAFLNWTAPALGGLLLAAPANAQQVLQTYIAQGLKSNQGIQQQSFLLEKSVYGLREAKSLFLPDVSFSSSYTRAQGGRTIDLPLGDLLNNAYTSLNQLTGTNAFPQVKNQHVLLNPDNFYDTKFHTAFPILNAELSYNKKIKAQQVDLQKEEVLLYKRELVKDIKTAYYQYLKAGNAVKIYESSLALVSEGLRVNTALRENEKVNRTAVLRSENEVSRISASLAIAQKTKESAKFYFNFLLNRPLTNSIQEEEMSALPGMDIAADSGVDKREELSKLKIAAGINANLTGMARSYIVPKVGTFLDLGSQAFDWKFDNNSRYYFFGVSLEWELFSFGKNSFRVKQAIADQNSIGAQTDYVRQQLLTELDIRQNDLLSATAQYQAAQTQLRTAQTYYTDELKLYKEGLVIYIELLDAQNQLIDARLQSNISLYDTWIAYAAIERANAGFPVR